MVNIMNFVAFAMHDNFLKSFNASVRIIKNNCAHAYRCKYSPHMLRAEHLSTLFTWFAAFKNKSKEKERFVPISVERGVVKHNKLQLG